MVVVLAKWCLSGAESCWPSCRCLAAAIQLPPLNPSFLHPRPPGHHRNPQQQLRACYRLIAKMPTLAAMAYKTSIGQPIIYPRNDLNYAENFLHMMFAGGWAS